MTTGMFVLLIIAISLSTLMSAALIVFKCISRKSKLTAATYLQNSADIVKDGTIPKVDTTTDTQIDFDAISTKITPLIEGLQTLIELIKTGSIMK